MPRRTAASACLAAITLFAGLAPGFPVPVAASSCSAWTSEATPPPSIRVFRHAAGTVETVNFKAYAKNVLSREWIGSWSTQSLRSGALMVRNYAWYQVLHWRGGVNAAGVCFDLRDDSWDQVYDPSLPTWSTAAAAVDATWSAVVHRDGRIFPTYYNAGVANESCGANANGWKAYQWGTQACGLAGLNAAQIVLIYYYPGVTVSGLAAGSPSSTPTPSPSPTPRPTPSPTAPTTPTPTPTPHPTATPTTKPSPSGSTLPSATPHASPTPVPTPLATPTVTTTPQPSTPPAPQPTASPQPSAAPFPTPPPDQQLPGGGQASVADVSVPPPPPPQHPKPVIAARVVEPDAISWSRETAAAGASGPLEFADARAHHGAWGGSGLAPLAAGGWLATGGDLERLSKVLGGLPLDARLVTFDERFPQLAAAFLREVARDLAGRGPLGVLLRP